MSQSGVVTFQLNPWPKGSDKTQHKLVLEGTTLIGTSTTTPIKVTAWSITSNVLTLTAINTLTGGGGDHITVSGFATSTFLNGAYTTTSATGTTIVMAKTHADGSATEAAQVVLTPQALTAGLPITWAFIRSTRSGNATPPLGPGAVPNWVEMYSAAGGAYNYKVNQTASPNTLIIYNGVTKLTDGQDITPDTIYFRAEFPYGFGGSGY